MDGVLSKEQNTAAMWPLEAGTRRHCAVMAGFSALAMWSPSTLPQTFMGSCSLFSSSPPM